MAPRSNGKGRCKFSDELVCRAAALERVSLKHSARGTRYVGMGRALENGGHARARRLLIGGAWSRWAVVVTIVVFLAYVLVRTPLPRRSVAGNWSAYEPAITDRADDASPIGGGRLVVAFAKAADALSEAWRFWVTGAALGAAVAFWTHRPHAGADLLGACGDGRLFYSGLRVSLTGTGRPSELLQGLACPRTASPWRSRRSVLGRVLREFHTDCQTNLALTGILLAHDSLSGAALVAKRVRSVLAVHAGGRGGVGNDTLTKALRSAMVPELLAVQPREVAALVLALEVGRRLCGTPAWGGRSQNLAARSVLHSLPSLPQDFSPEQRDRVRQALVYASRVGAFGPLPHPIGLSAEAGALRDWAEILLGPAPVRSRTVKHAAKGANATEA